LESELSLAMVFPGQGSQSQGMQADLAEKYSEVQATYAEASEILGYDLWRVVQDGPPERLGETVVTQPAMLAAGVAAWRIWAAEGGAMPSHMAGHSLGEYTALVCAGAVSFLDAMRVVKRRSELMQGAVPMGAGAMAAIIGMDDDAVREVCDNASGIGIVEAVNFNTPGQVVIAGQKDAVDRAIVRAEEVGARRAILLPVSVPSHSSLMIEAGNSLSGELNSADFSTPKLAVIGASDATAYGDADDIRIRLSRQVYSPVQWVSTINTMLEAGVSSIVECGPGKVLMGLVKRINRGTPVATIDSIDGLQKALQL